MIDLELFDQWRHDIRHDFYDRMIVEKFEDSTVAVAASTDHCTHMAIEMYTAGAVCWGIGANCHVA